MKHSTSSSKTIPPSIQSSGCLRLTAIAVAVVLAQLVGAAGHANAQVTYFERPPTANDLKRALTAGQPSTRPKVAQDPAAIERPAGVRSRTIVWSTDGIPPGPDERPVNADASSKAHVKAPISNGPGPSAYATAYEDRSSPPAAGMPINFASGSSRVDPSSAEFIRTVAEMMTGDQSLNLVIEGHTDAVGRFEKNMVLSWERAVGVYRLLVEQYGIAPGRLAVVGKGPTEPMPGTMPNDSSNRRVQFRLQG